MRPAAAVPGLDRERPAAAVAGSNGLTSKLKASSLVQLYLADNQTMDRNTFCCTQLLTAVFR